MSLYNNIRKIKYTKNPSDVVALQEYILFEDTHAKEKFVVFKFANNVNQRLFEIRLEVLQYGSDNALIEKSEIKHANFTCEANDTFVPNAKLKVNFECESLEVKLLSASFDRAAWENGEFKETPYRFEDYASGVEKPLKAEPQKGGKEKPATGEKPRKKGKPDFHIRNIFRINKSAFPAVLNVILCILVIGAIVFSAFYFKRSTGAFSVENFAVKETSTGCVAILGYSGNDKEVEIPTTLGDYRVVKISEGAFTGSDAESVLITTQSALTIETGAFNKCKNLVSINGNFKCGRITVMEGAIKDCVKLTTFTVPTAELYAKCFIGSNYITTLAFSKAVSVAKLLDLFDGRKSASIKLNITGMTATSEFLEGVTLR